MLICFFACWKISCIKWYWDISRSFQDHFKIISRSFQDHFNIMSRHEIKKTQKYEHLWCVIQSSYFFYRSYEKFYKLHLQITSTNYVYKLRLQITSTNYVYKLRLQITSTNYVYKVRLQSTTKITKWWWDSNAWSFLHYEVLYHLTTTAC